MLTELTSARRAVQLSELGPSPFCSITRHQARITFTSWADHRVTVHSPALVSIDTMLVLLGPWIQWWAEGFQTGSICTGSRPAQVGDETRLVEHVAPFVVLMILNSTLGVKQ